MHAGDRAVTMAGTSALTRSLVFAGVQVVVCVYISAVSVKMFNSDELCNFSKSVLGLLPGRGGHVEGGHVCYSQALRTS